MDHLEFLLIDVFTDRPFGGSRLTLFPDAADLAPQLMQQIALEMGCGETAFVTVSHALAERRAALRVFTPAVELPFAGHSVLGATFAFHHLGRLPQTDGGSPFVWELDAGRYRVYRRGDAANTIYSLVNDPPVFLGQYFHREKVARTLGLDEDEIAITGLPCEVISTGLPIHIVPLSSLEAMRSIKLRQREAEGIARDLGFGDLFVFTCETVGADVDVHCRMFAPHFGIPEDPASGSAVGSLTAYLVKHRLVKHERRLKLVCEQGLEMGRPSHLYVEASIENGCARDIQVGGHCVLVGRGEIALP